MSKNIPNLRFKGFSEEWKKNKLEDIVDRVTRKNTNLESTLPLTISAQHGLVDQVTFFNKQIASKDISGYFLLKKGEFAYNKSYSKDFPWGAVKRLDKYEKGVLSTLYIVFIPENVNSDFLVSYYDTNRWHKEVSMRAAEGARNHGLLNITAKDFFKTELKIPSTEKEQQKIGTLFKQLDDTIALQQQLIDQQKQYKRTMLKKMFPQEGGYVPEIRFEGFSGDWDEFKLGEISDKVTEKNKNNLFSETLTNSAEYGIINQREFFDKDISNKKNLDGYYIVRPDDFVYNPRISNFAPVGPIKRNTLGRTGVMSPLYYVFRVHNVNKMYLETYFSSNGWHKFMKLNGDSGARSDRFAIKDSVFREMPIPIPSAEEQQKIGSFFKLLDDTIALYQKKLEDYQQLKKALLQRIFI